MVCEIERCTVHGSTYSSIYTYMLEFIYFSFQMRQQQQIGAAKFIS